MRDTAEEFLGALEQHGCGFKGGHGKWMANCPGHDDRTPSLSIETEHDRLLVHCFAGCSPEDVVGELGWVMADLYHEPRSNGFAPNKAMARYPRGSKPTAGRSSSAPVAVAAVSEPTGPPVATGELLDEIAAFIGRFIVLAREQVVAVALWVAHAHAIDAADTTPYLYVVSAEKRSGKSRLLEVLQALAVRAHHTPNMSEAALFRLIEASRPTLLVDEVDALFKSGAERMEALRGVLNAGNRRGVLVYRCEGPKSEVRGYEVFGPKVLAGIDNGALSDTLLDRSIRIRLKRKTNADRVERLIWRDVKPEATALHDRAVAWAADVGAELELARPALPTELDDRAAEAWEPLLAIADSAGGGWPSRARASAVQLSAGEDEEESRGVQLLSDLRIVFGDRAAVLTEDLLVGLNGLEESRWGGWHEGQGIRARDLSRTLRKFEIKPKTVHTSERKARGYHREQLEDAWSRYLDPRQEASPTSPTSPSALGGVSEVRFGDPGDLTPTSKTSPLTHVGMREVREVREVRSPETSTRESANGRERWTEAEVDRLEAEHLDDRLADALPTEPCRCQRPLLNLDEDGESRCARCGRAAEGRPA